MAPLAMGEGYSAFLQIQYAARQPIESWFASHTLADVPKPPLQTPLIAVDLANLDQRPEPDDPEPIYLAPECMLGVAWAIAGSSLGNRAMLQRRLRTGEQALAHAFLADQAMPNYWQTILPLLESSPRPTNSAAALEGARAVFERFLACARDHEQKIPA